MKKKIVTLINLFILCALCIINVIFLCNRNINNDGTLMFSEFLYILRLNLCKNFIVVLGNKTPNIYSMKKIAANTNISILSLLISLLYKNIPFPIQRINNTIKLIRVTIFFFIF